MNFTAGSSLKISISITNRTVICFFPSWACALCLKWWSDALWALISSVTVWKQLEEGKLVGLGAPMSTRGTHTTRRWPCAAAASWLCSIGAACTLVTDSIPVAWSSLFTSCSGGSPQHSMLSLQCKEQALKQDRSIYLSIDLSINLFLCLSVCLSLSIFDFLYFSLSIFASFCPSLCLSLFLSVSLFIYHLASMTS